MGQIQETTFVQRVDSQCFEIPLYMSRTGGWEVISKSDIHAINVPLVYPALFDSVSAVILHDENFKSHSPVKKR